MAVRINIPELSYEQFTRLIINEEAIQKISTAAPLYEAMHDPKHRTALLALRCRTNLLSLRFWQEPSNANLSLLHSVIEDSSTQDAQSEETSPTAAKTHQVGLRLMYAKNASSKALNDFFPTKFSKSSIKDPEITSPSDEIDLENNKGVCRGMVEVFIHRYLKTIKDFSDEEAHLIAIAEGFFDGAPPESLLIQNFFTTYITDNKFTSPYCLNIKKKNNENEIIEQIKKLPRGIYKCNLQSDNLGHALALIKINEDNYYIFDPNLGLTFYKSANEIYKFLDEVYPEMTKYCFHLCDGKAPFKIFDEPIYRSNRNETTTRITEDIYISKNTFTKKTESFSFTKKKETFSFLDLLTFGYWACIGLWVVRRIICFVSSLFSSGKK